MEISTQKAHFFVDNYNPSGRQVVLLLHGLGVDRHSWIYQVPALTQAGYRVLVPDLPGFGQSQSKRRLWSIKSASKDIADLLEQLSISPALLVGISMGGVVALQFVLDYPLETQRIVLINTFSRLRPKRASNLIYLFSRFVLTSFRGVNKQAIFVAERLFPQPEQVGLRKMFLASVEKADERVYRQAMLSLFAFNVHRRLAEIKSPTLVITGEDDSTVPVPIQQELAQGISPSKHIIINKAGHAVTIDQPAAVNRAIIDFLKPENLSG